MISFALRLPSANTLSTIHTQRSNSRQYHRLAVQDSTNLSRCVWSKVHEQHTHQDSHLCAAGRREMHGLVGSTLLNLLCASPSTFAFEDGKQVSAYLPPSSVETGYFLFEAGVTRTPALRAGAIEPYRFSLPGDWKEIPVSNAKSGNYCQPRCDEATTEVQFANPVSGTLQVIIIPTNKLMVTEKSPSIDAVGSLDGVLDAVSPAITGSVAVEQEEVVSKGIYKSQGRNYYRYELLTPFAAYGLHNVASVTTSQNYVVIAAASANEKQWVSSQKVENNKNYFLE